MNEGKIVDLERRVTGVEATIAPLVSELRSLTQSNVSLTSEIKHLVKTVEKAMDDHEKLEKRVTESERDIAVMKSKGQWQEWAGRAVVTGIVSIVIGAVVYVISIKGA